MVVSFCILTPTLWKLPQLLNLSKIWCSPFICCCYFCFSDKIYVKCHLTMVLVFILEWLMYITSHIIICLSCSFFGEVSVHLFCCLFIWVSYFLIFVYSVILKYSGYILHLTSDLPIFCIFSVVSFKFLNSALHIEQIHIFKNFMNSNQSMFLHGSSF